MQNGLTPRTVDSHATPVENIFLKKKKKKKEESPSRSFTQSRTRIRQKCKISFEKGLFHFLCRKRFFEKMFSLSFFMVRKEKNEGFWGRKRNAKAGEVNCFGPENVECFFSLSLSSYAFMPEWLLPSLSEERFWKKTFVSTGQLFWDLFVLWGFFPFWLRTFAPRVFLLKKRFWNLLFSRERSSLDPPVLMNSPKFRKNIIQSWTEIHFAKNQICASLMSLSLLDPSHPRLLPQSRVRSSSGDILSPSTCSGLDRLPSDALRITFFLMKEKIYFLHNLFFCFSKKTVCFFSIQMLVRFSTLCSIKPQGSTIGLSSSQFFWVSALRQYSPGRVLLRFAFPKTWKALIVDGVGYWGI